MMIISWYKLIVKYINILILFTIFIFFLGCETIKNKSDAVVEKENQQYGKYVGETINKLKIELGNPSEDFINENGNKILVYKKKKFGIICERKFEINQKNVIISFSSSGCI